MREPAWLSVVVSGIGRYARPGTRGGADSTRRPATRPRRSWALARGTPALLLSAGPRHLRPARRSSAHGPGTALVGDPGPGRCPARDRPRGRLLRVARRSRCAAPRRPSLQRPCRRRLAGAAVLVGGSHVPPRPGQGGAGGSRRPAVAAVLLRQLCRLSVDGRCGSSPPAAYPDGHTGRLRRSVPRGRTARTTVPAWYDRPGTQRLQSPTRRAWRLSPAAAPARRGSGRR